MQHGIYDDELPDFLFMNYECQSQLVVRGWKGSSELLKSSEEIKSGNERFFFCLHAKLKTTREEIRQSIILFMSDRKHARVIIRVMTVFSARDVWLRNLLGCVNANQVDVCVRERGCVCVCVRVTVFMCFMDIWEYMLIELCVCVCFVLL